MGAYRDLLEDASGWRMAGAGGFRAVSRGIVESCGGPGLFWYARETFEDFLLAVEWRLSAREDNSGVFLRCPPLRDDPGPAIAHGYEVQIDDRGFDPARQVAGSALHLTGAIYGLAPATRPLSRETGLWNAFEISAIGPSIAVKLNGQEAAKLEHGTRSPRGHVALQSHHQGSVVRFRNLRVLPL